MDVKGPGRSVGTAMKPAGDSEEPVDADASISVAAHGMLNALSVARATVTTIRTHWSHFDDDTRDRLLSRAEEQLAFLGDLLGDLVRGIPPETRAVLDELRVERRPPTDI